MQTEDKLEGGQAGPGEGCLDIIICRDWMQPLGWERGVEGV